MRIVDLVENTEGVPGCVPVHGLSFYIETPKHRVLVDTGPADEVIRNAAVLGIDLAQVDTVVLSHGHYDHGGGLAAVAKAAPEAAIYMRREAAGRYYSTAGHGGKEEEGPRYIGLDHAVLALPQVVFVDGDTEIDDELFLFGDVHGRRLWPETNRALRVMREGSLLQDDFAHEQALVVRTEGKNVLLSGCAHGGICNILDRYREIFGTDPDLVISGFHMMRGTGYSPEDLRAAEVTAAELAQMRTRFCTCHCTGIEPYEVMHRIMGGQLSYVHCGEEVAL